ncbi:hypothetical protein AX15_002383 [Amanita polypyramis BW_CC]|nr:hypothetical protein AX15_002383 [Amanita polypyramis BW_CC]
MTSNKDLAQVSTSLEYTKDQLATLPEGASPDLSYGNSVEITSLKEGEHVIDLGSGAGVYVFLAASKVGSTGQVVGLDDSQDMISLARRNAASRDLKPPHVSFVKASLFEGLPVVSDSVDYILSNCALNHLSPTEKVNLLREAYRTLRPGGRLNVNDVIAKAPFSDNIRKDLIAYVNHISCTITIQEYSQFLSEAGFQEISLTATGSDLNIYNQGNSRGYYSEGDSTTQSSNAPTKPPYNINDYVASYQIYGVKPGIPSSSTLDILQQWWDAYPMVKASPPRLTTEEVANLVRGPGGEEKMEYAVIDVRRNDHAGGHVRGSHQWPAQTFYDDLPRFFEKFKDTKKVVFYCGSSQGRGPRCAGWYQDYLDGVSVDHTSNSYVMQGGIKEWLVKFKGQDDLVDYD